MGHRESDVTLATQKFDELTSLVACADYWKPWMWLLVRFIMSKGLDFRNAVHANFLCISLEAPTSAEFGCSDKGQEVSSLNTCLHSSSFALVNGT